MTLPGLRVSQIPEANQTREWTPLSVPTPAALKPGSVWTELRCDHPFEPAVSIILPSQGDIVPVAVISGEGDRFHICMYPSKFGLPNFHVDLLTELAHVE